MEIRVKRKFRLTGIYVAAIRTRMSSLRAWRKANDLSLDDVASKLGIAVSSLSRIELGQQWPSRPLLDRIIDMTGGDVTPNDLAGFVPRSTEAAE
jgi:transcriptional regulator with XRE-family HTH domain